LALHSLIFGVPHSNLLEVGTEIEIHNNGLLDEGDSLLGGENGSRTFLSYVLSGFTPVYFNETSS